MRPLRLSTLLIGVNVGLLLAAVIVVAFMAMRFLRQLADEQALARVRQAETSAQNAVARFSQNLVMSAQLLGERPTLLRLLQANDTPSLESYLTQFRQTTGLDGCSVLRDGQVVAQSGMVADWPAVWAARGRAQDYFFYARPAGDPLIVAAWWAIPSLADGAVLVAVQLDEAFSRQLTEEIGLPATILEPRAIQTPGPLTALRTQALDSGEPVVAQLADPDRYAAIAPLRAPTGAVAGLIETELSAVDVNRSLSQLVQTLLLLAAGVALVAGLVSLFVGRRLSLPLQALTAAAARIGRGDLVKPVPLAPGFEIGTLSITLEDMRRRLLQLTANLRRQQIESNAIVTGIVEGVFIVNRERQIQFLNPRAAALLGVEAGEAMGRFCGDVLNPQRDGGVRPCEEECPIIHARFRAGARATEHLLLRSGGRRSVVITSAPPLDDRISGGSAEIALADLQQIQVMRDETEEEAMRRVRDAVLANISHEFKTPLSAQLASIEILLDQLPELTSDQIAALVVSLQRGTLRLTQLIDNLLESVRIEAGRFAVRRRPVPMDEVIEQALEMMRPLIDQRQQEVTIYLPYPLPSISGDAPLLTQVFVNLLANANKFSPAGSTIRIGGSLEPETLTVWVEDQGPGLPPADESVFVPFVRSAGEEPEAQGVGLGLWIVKSIVERHGGRVDAQSSTGGTRISVTLPRDKTG